MSEANGFVADGRWWLVAGIWVTALAGCSPSADPSTSGDPAEAASVEHAPISDVAAPSPTAPALPTISLDGAEHERVLTADTELNEVGKQRQLIEAMDPLQVMLGTWKGTTQRAFGDFNALDEPEWVWDFQTDPDQPAMVMTSEASPYFREMRLTYNAESDRYQLQTTDTEGQVRRFSGAFSQPVEEFQGDDKRLHRRFKLALVEVEPDDPQDAWQVVFNQQDNNRYLVELSERRGSRFARFDTVGNQRQGTSFAYDDSDYGEKACIITGGLGTSTVSYNGKTYWVCCSGCRAAFEEDPEKWIAAAADLPDN